MVVHAKPAAGVPAVAGEQRPAVGLVQKQSLQRDDDLPVDVAASLRQKCNVREGGT